MGSERFIPATHGELASDERQRTIAARQDAVQVFLRGQDASALAQRLWAWAQTDHSLMAELKAWAAQSQTGDDPTAMKTAITDLLRSPGFLDWRESGAYAHRAEKVLDLLEPVLATNPVQARELCEHALRRLYKASEEADDSNGAIGELLHRVMDSLLRCLRAAPPSADWLDDWFGLMEAHPWGLWNESAVLEVAGAAVQQGFQRKAARDWQNWLASHPSGQAEGEHRFDYGRHALRQRYLNVLKSQGDSQAALEMMGSSLSGASEHSELVAYCESLGKLREALQYARAAARLHPTNWRSEQDLLRCYERDGWDEEALAIRRGQLERSPTVEHFQAALKAATAAGREPVAYRDELFAWAEAREQDAVVGGRFGVLSRGPAAAKGRHVGTRAAWLLAEGRLDDAVQLVQPPHVCEPQLLRTMAMQLPQTRYPEAVLLLQRVFAVSMPGASTPYRDVLEIVGETARRMAEPARSQWLAWLRAEYKAKRNFIKGLDAFKGWG